MLRQKSIGMSSKVGVSGMAAGEGEAARMSLQQKLGVLGMFFSTSTCDHSSLKLGKELRLCCWANLGWDPDSCPPQLCDLGQVALFLWA